MTRTVPTRIVTSAVTAALVAGTLILGGCATTWGDTAPRDRAVTTSNAPAGAAAASNAGTRAVGAYGAIGTSDDVRGRTGSSSASQLTGRATMAGSDSGTRKDVKDDEPPR